MKQNLFLFGLMAVVAMAGITTIDAATSGTVSATVTPESISITVSDGVVSYGNLTLSGSGDTTSVGLNDSQTSTNTGNILEDFNIRGSNSADWTLAGTSGADQYVHSFCKTTCDSTPVWNALTTSNQSLATAVSAAGTQVFDLKLDMPTSSSSFTTQSVDVVIQAVAN